MATSTTSHSKARKKPVSRAPSLFLRYGSAFAGIGILLVLRLLAQPWLGDRSPFTLFLPGVMLAAWYGGLAPGVLAIILGAIAGDFFFVRPYYHFGFPTIGDAAGFVVFVMAGIMITLLSEAQRNAQAAAEENAREAREHDLALQHSEDSLARAQRVANLGSWDWDLESGQVRWSEQMYRIFGLDPLHFNPSHDSVMDYFHPEDRERLETAMRDALSVRGRVDLEQRIKRPDGRERVVLWQADVIKDSVGKPVRMIGTALDITDRAHAEQAVREGDQQLRLITDAAPILISYVDRDLRYQFVNKSYGDWFDRPAEEIIGKTLEEVLGEPVYLSVKDNAARALSGEQVSFENSVYYRDGKRRNIHVTYVPDRAPDDTVKGFVAVVADITARKRAEEDLQRRTEEITLLYDAGQLLSSTLDAERIHDIFRQQVMKVMPCDSLLVSAYNPENNLITCTYAYVDGKRMDVSTFPPLPLAPEGQGLQSTVIRTGEPMLVRDLQEHKIKNFTKFHVEKDGTVSGQPSDKSPVPKSALFVPIKLEGKVIGAVQVQCSRLAAYTEDHLRLLEALMLQVAAASRNALLYQQAREEIEERARVEEILQERQEDIEELNRRLRRAMAETHHRVKNNLQIISALVDMQVLGGADTIRIDELRRMGQHIRSLAAIHDLLTQEAKNDAELDFLSTRAALEKLLPVVEAMVNGRRLQVNVEDTRLPVRQGTSLAVLVNELVSNAVKHGQGDIGLSFQMLPGSNGHGPRARLEVTDQGPGFPPDFDPAKAANTGVELIESLGRWDLQGDVEYTNRPEGGARVVVTFPLTTAPAPPTQTKSAHAG